MGGTAIRTVRLLIDYPCGHRHTHSYKIGGTPAYREKFIDFMQTSEQRLPCPDCREKSKVVPTVKDPGRSSYGLVYTPLITPGHDDWFRQGKRRKRKRRKKT